MNIIRKKKSEEQDQKQKCNNLQCKIKTCVEEKLLKTADKLFSSCKRTQTDKKQEKC